MTQRSAAPSLPVLLLSLLSLFSLAISSVSGQFHPPTAPCYTCPVTACSSYLSELLSVQFTTNSFGASDGPLICVSMNIDIGLFINSSSPTCQPQVNAFLCEAVTAANTTETGCALSTVGSATYNFTERCNAIESTCLSPFFAQEFNATSACSSFRNFVLSLPSIEMAAATQPIYNSSSSSTGRPLTNGAELTRGGGRMALAAAVVGMMLYISM